MIMKKNTFLIIAILFLSATNAQILLQENFNSIPNGNVGIDITGQIPTNDLYTYSENGTSPTATNAGNSNFQIVYWDQVQGKILKLTGTNGSTGQRNFWKGDFYNAWIYRDEGNNVLQVEFDLYTGIQNGSLNKMCFYITSENGNKILAGYSYDTNTKVLSAVCYSTPAGYPSNNYNYSLGSTANDNITLNWGTWYRLGLSFDLDYIRARFKGPGFYTEVQSSATVEPEFINFLSYSGTTSFNSNTTSNYVYFDNFITKATLEENLLANEYIQVPTNFTIAPNPSSRLITIGNSENDIIKSVTISDINGRIIKQLTQNEILANELNISDLKIGVYLIKIESEKGSTIEKFVKN